MRLNELKGQTIHQKVDNFITSVSEQYGTSWLFDTHVSNRMWTRGDGKRYKELSRITSFFNTDQIKTRAPKDLKDLPDEIQDTPGVIDLLWKEIESKGKHVGQLSDEFPSIPRGDCYVLDKVLYVRRGGIDIIQYGSLGRLKNSEVWNTKK
jgi:hypothetical protein